MKGKQIMKNRNFIFTTILLALGCFALCPRAQAVSPPPDGGYPGGNTAEGANALFSLTTGGYNTAIGFFSLKSNAAGSFNTATGAGALLLNTADDNTAFGATALLLNTSGGNNTAVGATALLNNSEGSSNSAFGWGALASNTTADDNTATGFNALFSNTEGVANTANGSTALFSNTIGGGNTAFGGSALNSNTTGNSNTANGVNALVSNTDGSFNTANGRGALFYNTAGSNNTALGYQAGFGVTTASNVICIGADGNNVNNSCYIGNIFNATSSGGTAVYINSNGRLGTMTSSRRFKEEIKPMDKASEVLLALKPVTFRYKKEIDPQAIPEFGLIAEEVEKVNPDLIIRDKEGKPYTVRYEQINAMLLNEFLKEHRTVQELKSEIAALTATAKEQAAQIQKVSARLDVSERRSRIVLNDPQNDRGR
jgi:hypothetical protein